MNDEKEEATRGARREKKIDHNRPRGDNWPTTLFLVVALSRDYFDKKAAAIIVETPGTLLRAIIL